MSGVNQETDDAVNITWHTVKVCTLASIVQRPQKDAHLQLGMLRKFLMSDKGLCLLRSALKRVT
jgi:hypothetical protein